jgi:NAD(P)-dependent dehydrogenase (short-subunit alcohol dehydrogenase family)
MADLRRVAVVTGASRGIGRACAKALAAKGLDVYLVAEGAASELRDVCAECAGARAEFGLFDLAQPGSAEAIAAAALDAFGRIDVLVNNAGIRIRHPFGEFSAADFANGLLAILVAATRCVVAHPPRLQRQRVDSVRLSAGCGHVGRSGMTRVSRPAGIATGAAECRQNSLAGPSTIWRIHNAPSTRSTTAAS